MLLNLITWMRTLIGSKLPESKEVNVYKSSFENNIWTPHRGVLII